MPRLTPTLWLNDWNLARAGFVVAGWTGLGEPAEQFHQEEKVLGRAGVILSDGRPDLKVREVEITLSLIASTAALARTAMDKLHALIGSGVVEMRVSPWSDRVWRGKLTAAPFRFTAPQAASRTAQGSIRFRCQDPYGYDRRGVVVNVAGTSDWYEAPLGGAPSAPIVRFQGAATSPAIRVRRADGTIVGELGVTATLGANDWLEVDMGRQTLSLSTDGVVTDAITTALSGDFFALDPAWGDPLASVWPRLQVTSGTAQVRYWKAYS
jgi:phage-related protein